MFSVNWPEHDGDDGPGAGGHDREADEVPEDVTGQVPGPWVTRGQRRDNEARGDGQPQGLGGGGKSEVLLCRR